jgi:hypothetical protein
LAKSKESKEKALKKLVNLKSYLEARLRGLEEEVEQIKGFLDVVDEVVISKSFQKVEVTPQSEEEQVIPLRSRSGVVLAKMYISSGHARIKPEKDITFDTSTPPFKTFLVRRILETMQKQDEKRMKKGEVEPDRILSFEVNDDNGLLNEIAVNNYGDDKRLMEIKSSTRWTLEKMYEKTAKKK